ncbi:MAG: T9SS type A sorting domain-containing protein [Bacteroidales bacterium]|nr:T9SS type A sorting domain-containing protein [Bacteroidales bacterium]
MKKNLTLIFSFLLLGFLNVNAQHHHGEWARHFDGNGTSAFNNIAFDGQDIIAIGHYIGLEIEYEDLDLPMEIGGQTLIIKMDTQGNHIWHSTIVGDGFDVVYDFDIDSENNIVVAGSITTSMPLKINGEVVYTPPFAWTSRALVAKFDGLDGSLIWVRIIEPTEQYTDVNATRMTVDDNDNIYIGGYHSIEFEFQDIEFDYEESFYSLRLFALKLDNDGDAVWGKSFPYSTTASGGGFVTPRTMAYVDDHIYFGFEYSKPLVMDEITLPYSGQYYWLALAKIDVSNGDVIDVKAFGSEGGQGLSRMKVDNAGEIVLGGWFSHETGLTIGDITLEGYGIEDGFVAKFNTDLDVIWAKDMGTESISRAFNIKIAEDDRIFIGGGFHAETYLMFDGEPVIEPDDSNSLGMFEVVIDKNANFLKAFALHANNEMGMVEYRDGILLPGDIVYAAGATLDSVALTRTLTVWSDHNQGFIMEWDLFNDEEIQLYQVTFIVEDQEGNVLENAVITFHGTAYEEGAYTFIDLEPGVYEYAVSHQGYFPESGQVEIDDEDIVHTVVMTVDNTSVNDFAGNSLQVFPNPASTHLNIRTSEMVTEIVLMDVRGTIVKRIENITNSVVIDLSGFASGMYLIRITGNDINETRKLQITN